VDGNVIVVGDDRCLLLISAFFIAARASCNCSCATFELRVYAKLTAAVSCPPLLLSLWVIDDVSDDVEIVTVAAGTEASKDLLDDSKFHTLT